MKKYIHQLPANKRTVFTKRVYKPIRGPRVSIPIGVIWIPQCSLWRFRWVDECGTARTVSVNPIAFKNRDHAFQAICDIAKMTYKNNSRLKPGYYKKFVAGVFCKHNYPGVQVAVTYYDTARKNHAVTYEYVNVMDFDNPAVKRVVKKFSALRTKSFKQYRLDYLAAIPKVVDKVLYKDGTRF